MLVTINKEAFEHGVRAGFAGERGSPYPVKTEESFSYASGWIEGEAARGGFEVTMDVARICGLVKDRDQ